MASTLKFLNPGPLPFASPWYDYGPYIFYKNGGVIVGNPTGGNKGVGTINAEDLYINGVLVSFLSIHSEQLNVLSNNVLSELTYPYAGNIFQLIVNGRIFMPLGSSPPFSVSEKVVTWLSTIFSLTTNDEVNAIYSFEA